MRCAPGNPDLRAELAAPRDGKTSSAGSGPDLGGGRLRHILRRGGLGRGGRQCEPRDQGGLGVGPGAGSGQEPVGPLQSARDLVSATGIAFLVGDQATTLELGRHAIHDLQWGGDRLRMGFVLHLIAGVLAATRPDDAAIILGAADVYVTAPAQVAQLMSLIVGAALGEERARELRARGAGLGWNQVLAYTLAQATQALDELQSQTQP